MRVVPPLILCLALLAGCGGEGDPAPPPTPSDGTRLEVVVRPEGPDGPVRREVVTDVPETITAQDFEPVPDDVACIQIFGGPATAQVTGRLRGTPIDATFERTDGCEIRRWDRVSALLGRVSGPATP